jgi:aminopeptidase N
LNSLRHSIHNDTLWWGLFRSFHQRHLRGHATTEDFISLVNERTGQDFRPFFEQYLNRPHLPVLEYRLNPEGRKLQVLYRWTGVPMDFAMPVELGLPGKWVRVVPKADYWQPLWLPKCSIDEFRVATDKWLIKTKYVK